MSLALDPIEPPKAPTVPDLLRSGAEQFEAKDALYGSSYRSFGRVMVALYPDGLRLDSEEDWNRLGILVQVVGKLHRYAPNLKTGGHADSAHDLMVYGAMLKEITHDQAPTPSS